MGDRPPTNEELERFVKSFDTYSVPKTGRKYEYAREILRLRKLCLRAEKEMVDQGWERFKLMDELRAAGEGR